MIDILYVTIIVVICVLVWFLIPYSPLKSEFEKENIRLFQNVSLQGDTFSEELLSKKPELLQRYIRYCGLYNQPMMKSSLAIHNNAKFLLKDGSPMIKIQYRHVNFSTICERLAFIDTKIAGILPFQGLDDNVGGKGQMRGVVAKLFNVFSIQGKEMDISSLVKVLAEGIVCPSFLMHEDISWDQIDSRHLRARLTQYDITVSGIFEFDEDGAITSFYTKDRYEENNGTTKRQDWKAECGDYIEIDGVKRPTTFNGAWVYPDYEKVYFDCSDVMVLYKY